ncbi:MAG: phage regulatory CII family protein [Methylophilaceae bacterium]|nr:phage regulatory CII family protein [Methyloradius sp.]
MIEKNVLNLADLAYQIAHNFPGGVQALAQRMGMSYTVLKNKLNPNCSTHHLNIEELEAIVMLADTDELAHWATRERNGVFVPIMTQDEVNDMELLDCSAISDERYGLFKGKLRRILADGIVTLEELKELKLENFSLQQAIMTLIGRVESLVRKPGK